MELDMAQHIAEAAAEEGADLQVREAYSGRGMYGDTTAALEAEDFDAVLVGVASYAYQQGENGSAVAERRYEDMLLWLRMMRQDQMGLGIVVY